MILKAISLALILVAAATAKASFEENAHRYLSAQELTDSMTIYFEMRDSKCQGVTDANSSMTGVSSPISGNPIAPSPTQSTVQWIAMCISQSFASESGDSVKLQVLAGSEVDTWIQTSPYGSDDNTKRMLQYSLPWSRWPDNIKAALIKNMVSTLLGSDDVIQDFGLTTGDKLRTRLLTWANQRSDQKVLEIMKGFSINLVLRDEFLSY